MTSYTPSVNDLIILSGTLRVVLLFMVALAVHDIVRNGLYVTRVSIWARVTFYALAVSIAASVAASLFRISGYPWSPAYRELSHSAVSLSLIAVCVMVLASRTMAGHCYSPTTGNRMAHTMTGPLRDRTRSA